MANAISWGIWLVSYQVLIFVLVSIISLSSFASESEFTFQNTQAMASLEGTQGNPGVQIVCSGNGSISLENPNILLFTYVPSSTTLSPECAEYCVNEDAFGIISGYSCQGYCVNLTLNNGRQFASCNSDPNGYFGAPDWMKFIIGFYTFNINVGVPILSWIIPLLFVYLPVGIGLGFVFVSFLRGIN